MRIIYFGMRGILSKVPLLTLLKAGIEIEAVVVPAEHVAAEKLPLQLKPPPPPPSDLPLATPYVSENIIHLAWQHQVPVWAVGSLKKKKTQAWLKILNPDLICVVCFPYIFPKAVLGMPTHGCLNLHPSLLPKYRGPTPLYWILKNRERRTGVTLHFLDEGIDSGDIVYQTAFPISAQVTEPELTLHCAEAGAKLLLKAIQQVRRGPLPRHPQNEAEASYYPMPG